MLITLQKTTELFFILTLFLLPTYIIGFSFLCLPTNILEISAISSIILFIIKEKSRALKKWRTILQNTVYPIVFLFLGLFLSFLTNPWTLSGLGIIKGWFLIPLLFSLSLLSILKNKHQRLLIPKIIYASIFSVSLISLGYKLNGFLTYDERLRAFYLSPNHLAMFLAFGFFIYPLIISTSTNPRSKKWLRFSILPILIASYLTFSYATWTATIFSLVVVFLVKIKNSFIFSKKYIFILISIFLMFFIFQHDNPKIKTLFDSRSSLSSRLIIWRSSLKMIQENPLHGIGPGNFQAQYLENQKYFSPYLEWAVPHPHNLYLAFYLQTGLLGGLAFLFICKKMFISGIKQKDINLSIMLLGIISYTLIHGLIDTPFWKNDLAYFFWIMFFLSTSFYNKNAENL